MLLLMPVAPVISETENALDSYMRFAFETASAGAFGRPPLRPRARAADSPFFVRSTIKSRSS